ncbi:MAG: hypothetical protein PHW46_01195 [Candidatus Omnitrophica bacterium]|nr:hypothetical protein [Candidatus Omnitrophota bacterium]
MKAKKSLKKLSMSHVSIFKIKNRRGFAATCKDNLTEGSSKPQAISRMNKALRRMGFTLGQ